MNGLDSMIGRLRKPPPGSDEIMAAAQRAAVATNDRLREAKVPMVAKVRRQGAGARVVLVQTAPLRRRFSSVTPAELLHANVVKEMAVAKRNIAVAARKALTK